MSQTVPVGRESHFFQAEGEPISRPDEAKSEATSAEAVKPERRDREVAVKLLHLSDLHFGSTFDPSLWDYVAKILAGHDRPNVIVVTGDLVDTPSFFMLGLARNELEATLASWCQGNSGCELVVIPGNHDVGIWGNFAWWPWRSKFAIVFSEERGNLFKKLPTYSVYIKKRWLARWGLRTLWTARFALLRITFRLRRPPPGASVVSMADRSLCFAKFDSSQRLFLASGYIGAAEINKIYGELLQRRGSQGKGVLLNLVPRIALVHHHVVAIPYSSVVERPTDFEPFLTLRNAGTLLRTLCTWDFDLVLHGHKHLLNFVRVTFDPADQPRSEIAVLAAGSATKRLTLSGMNSFNLIKVHRGGSITYRSVRYGQGVSGEIDSPWNTGFQRLLPLSEVKVRAYWRALSGQGIDCDSTEFRCKVRETGSAVCRRRFRGLRGVRDEHVRERRLTLAVKFGAIAVKTVRLDDDSLLAGHILNPIKGVALQRVDADIRLARQRITAGAGIDFALTWFAESTFASSRWECLAMGQEDERDWVALVVRFPTKRLRITVALPDTFRNPDPQLIVRRCPDYPLMRLNPEGEVEWDGDPSKSWDVDPDLMDLEKGSVRMNGSVCEVDIQYPLVGHYYELRWRVDTAVASTTTERRGLAEQFRRTFLEIARAENERASALSKTANEILKKLTDQVIRPLIGSKFALDEQIDCALFVYNDEGKRFEIVAEGRTGNPGPLLVRQIPLNAGVSGTAFKRRGVSLFVCSSCADEDEQIAYIYFQDDAKPPEYAALLAIPLSLSDLRVNGELSTQGSSEAHESRTPVAPEELIAVFTIATTARDSPLLGLAGAEATQDKLTQKQELVNDLWAVAGLYLQGLGDAVRKAITAG